MPTLALFAVDQYTHRVPQDPPLATTFSAAVNARHAQGYELKSWQFQCMKDQGATNYINHVVAVYSLMVDKHKQ